MTPLSALGLNSLAGLKWLRLLCFSLTSCLLLFGLLGLLLSVLSLCLPRWLFSFDSLRICDGYLRRGWFFRPNGLDNRWLFILLRVMFIVWCFRRLCIVVFVLCWCIFLRLLVWLRRAVHEYWLCDRLIDVRLVRLFRGVLVRLFYVPVEVECQLDEVVLVENRLIELCELK